MDNLYIRRLTLPGVMMEAHFFKTYSSKGLHSSPYPYGIFADNDLEEIIFSPITIFCGDNGSGKSTLLNILAQCLGITHSSPYNAAYYLRQYVDYCDWECDYEPWEKKIITSDDVFDLSFQHRKVNMAINTAQDEIRHDADKLRESHNMSVNCEDPEDVARAQRKVMALKKNGTTRMALREVGRDKILHSNGENALEYFEEKIRSHGLYLLDEPENSLSIKNQLKLKQFIEEMIHYESCQFIIATHSPFLLALNNATVYNLDLNPVRTQHWSNIEHVRDYFNFFHDNEKVFINPIPDNSTPNARTQSAGYTFIQILLQHGYPRRDAERMLMKMGKNLVQICVEWIDDYIAKNYYFPVEATLRSAVSIIAELGEYPAQLL